MSSELKPCPNPACGNTEHAKFKIGFGVWCRKCGTGGPEIIHGSMEEKIAAWNSLPRRPDPAVQALVEAAEALLKDYVEIGESGDCGFWDVDTLPEVINMRAALAAYEENANG